MVNYMEELSVTEADNLKKTIAALFRQTCILQMKYDPVHLSQETICIMRSVQDTESLLKTICLF